jgi:hypothetical protein
MYRHETPESPGGLPVVGVWIGVLTVSPSPALIAAGVGHVRLTGPAVGVGATVGAEVAGSLVPDVVLVPPQAINGRPASETARTASAETRFCMAEV